MNGLLFDVKTSTFCPEKLDTSMRKLNAPYYGGGQVLKTDGQITQATSRWWLVGAQFFLKTFTTIWI